MEKKYASAVESKMAILFSTYKQTGIHVFTRFTAHI